MSAALKLCDVTGDVMTFDVTRQAIITRIFQICLLRMLIVASFKHLQDSRGAQITA